MIPDITFAVPGDISTCAFDYYHGTDMRTFFQRLVGIGLERRMSASAHRLISGNERLAVRVQYPVFQCFRGKAAEYDRMYCAYPGTGQHGDSGLGDHRQINGYAVAFIDTARFQNIGQAADLFVQFPICDAFVQIRFVAFPEDGNLVSAIRQVPVQTIVRNVEIRPGIPFDIRLIKIPIRHLVPFPAPTDQFFRLLRPESILVFERTPVHIDVLCIRQQGTRFY